MLKVINLSVNEPGVSQGSRALKEPMQEAVVELPWCKRKNYLVPVRHCSRCREPIRVPAPMGFRRQLASAIISGSFKCLEDRESGGRDNACAFRGWVGVVV